MVLRSSFLRTLSAAAFLFALSSTLMAQLPGGSPLGGQAPVAPMAPPRTPAERLDDLKREIDRLKGEIEFIEQRSAQGVQPLRDRLQNRKVDYRTIDAGTSAIASVTTPQPMQPQLARRMTSEELQKYPEEVLMVVQGRPVRRADLQRTIDYLATVPAAGDEAARQQRATMEVIRLEAMLASFEESHTEAQSQIQAAAQELADGKTFAEVQNRYGRGPNLAAEGKVQITRFTPFGLEVEAVAFSTPEGKVSAPVRGASGYAIVAVDKVQKSDQDAGDLIEARLLFVPYHGDPGEMDKVRNMAMTGQVDLVVRDDAALQMLPMGLRPQGAVQKGLPRELKAETIAPEQPSKKQEEPAKKDGK